MTHKAVLLTFCLVFLTVTALAMGPGVKTGSATTGGSFDAKKEVLNTVEKYLGAFDAKDIEGIMATFADTPETVMIGTGPNEIWLGKDEIRLAHSAFITNSDKETSNRTVVSFAAEDHIAWLTGYIDVTGADGEGDYSTQVNLSFVLKQIDNSWYITAMHFSKLTSP